VNDQLGLKSVVKATCSYH